MFFTNISFLKSGEIVKVYFKQIKVINIVLESDSKSFTSYIRNVPVK